MSSDREFIMNQPITAQLVYFIRTIGCPYVKIGMAVNPLKRLDALQVGCPHDLDLMGMFPGGRALELHLHKRLSTDHVRGEWFKITSRTWDVLSEMHLGNISPNEDQKRSTEKAEESRSLLAALRAGA